MKSNSTKKIKPAIKLQCEHVSYIFSNRDQSFGIERLVRAILVIVPFVYPTLYVRHLTSKKGVAWRHIAVEILVLSKVLILLLLLSFAGGKVWAAYFSGYLVSETVLYLLAVVLLSDIYSPPISKGRSFILLCINYIEINIGFSIIYLAIGGIECLSGKIDALYFSFVSFTTLGYGDKYPIIWQSKILVIIQLMVMLLFVFLFFMNLVPRMKNANQRLHKDRS